MIFMLDNYDSFTYNLVHMLAKTGQEIVVKRNRDVTPAEVLALKPQAILLSPGPGRPQGAGCMMDLIAAAAGKIPMLGVCLGHQAIGAHFGAEVVHAKSIMHGKTSAIRHDGQGLFAGLPQGFLAVRYHSLALDASTVPSNVKVTAKTDDGEIMGVRVTPEGGAVVEGIQYHPESIMSEFGLKQINNFLREAGVLC
ncbi:MAG: aminodeoxychorismate/anthranilate synthase component II [Lentisphaeria bacterium]|jgi:anthranilate synthase/aminodeoxychorismate synthase-like glutamine amidotransferase|nr:aminodeoxychorismate/anthranilate synthase component II [Lentisphaeria bacterium]MDD6337904.1 aminodeoxychorismate/anthranilate synthase component II [Lentisphaeria bacterium]